MEDQVRSTLDRWLLAETQHRMADAGRKEIEEVDQQIEAIKEDPAG